MAKYFYSVFKTVNITSLLPAFFVFIVGFCAISLFANAASEQSHILKSEDAYKASMAGEIIIIDIRTAPEWKETGTAPKAERVDFYKGARHMLDSVLQIVDNDKNKPIALICRTGSRTTTAYKFLVRQGFTKVYNIKEGMAGSYSGLGWLKKGLPVEK